MFVCSCHQVKRQVKYSKDSDSDSPPGYDGVGLVETSEDESDEDAGESGQDAWWEDITLQLNQAEEETKSWKPVLPAFETKGSMAHRATLPEPAGPRGFASDTALIAIFLALLGPLPSIGVKYTNRYAAQTKRKHWCDTTELEFMAFFGVILYLGRMHICRADAWRNGKWGNQWVQSVMGQRRFRELYACWHFVDNDKFDTGARKKDAFWQVRPMILALQKTFQKYYTAAKEISLDEMTTPFKGKSRAKQYNPNKPNKWGFKDFALCEAMTGYCLYFWPYQGKDQAKPTGQSLAEFAIRMALTEAHHHAGYLLAMDNWFMCLAGVLFCLSVGVHVVGTLRTGRTGFPSKSLLSLDNAAERGAVKVFQNTKHSVYACVWKDNKLVRLVTTFPFGLGICKRTLKKGGYSKATVAQPQCVGCYNRVMGGCDLGDQCKAYIRPVIRSRVCPVTVRDMTTRYCLVCLCRGPCAPTCWKSWCWSSIMHESFSTG